MSNGRIDGDKPERGWAATGGGEKDGGGAVRRDPARRSRKRKEEHTYARGEHAARRRVGRVFVVDRECGREGEAKRSGENREEARWCGSFTNTYEKYPLHEWCTPTFRQPGDESKEGGMAGSRGVDGRRE